MLFEKMWYCKVNMSEKQKDSEFIKKAAASAAGFALLAGGTWAAGSIEQNNKINAIQAEQYSNSVEEIEAYKESIKAAVDATYDSSAYIDTIKVEEDDISLGTLAENKLKTVYGEDIYNRIADRLYSPLFDSAALHNPQPGNSFALVNVDLNPEAQDGQEVIVVEPTHVIHSNVTEIPSPIIESSP